MRDDWRTCSRAYKRLDSNIYFVSKYEKVILEIVPRSDAGIKVADEVWIATALLHRERPGEEDFSLKEIEQRLREENLAGGVRAGVYPHISVHCVANAPPNPGRYRMLFATGPSRRRLFRHGDLAHPRRGGAKTRPRRSEIPAGYHELLDWYEHEWSGNEDPGDPLLALAGSGGTLWGREPVDEFIDDLRSGRP